MRVLVFATLFSGTLAASFLGSRSLQQGHKDRTSKQLPPPALGVSRFSPAPSGTPAAAHSSTLARSGDTTGDIGHFSSVAQPPDVDGAKEVLGKKEKDPDSPEEPVKKDEDEHLSSKEKAKKQATGGLTGGKFLTLSYWWPMLCVCVGLLFMTEVAFPACDRYLPQHLVAECSLFVAVWFMFAGIVFWTWDGKSAGHVQLVAMAAIMMAVAVLTLIFLISFTARRTHKEHDPTRALALDIAILFRPLVRMVLFLLIIDVVVSELSVDTGGLVLLLAFMLLGLALAVSGVITDLISHIFIRLDEFFYEGDIIMVPGGREMQVERVQWRHTVAMDLASRAQVYIPNRALSIGDTIINLSRDKGRKFDYKLPLAAGLQAEDLQAIVRESWDIVNATQEEGFTFKALDGKSYANQLLTNKCMVHLVSMSETGGGGEFAKFDLRLMLWGRYFYSNPPPWTGSGEEPDKQARQNDWKKGWFAHVEHILIAVKAVLEKRNSKNVVSMKMAS